MPIHGLAVLPAVGLHVRLRTLVVGIGDALHAVLVHKEIVYLCQIDQGTVLIRLGHHFYEAFQHFFQDRSRDGSLIRLGHHFYEAFQHFSHGFQKSVGRLCCKNSIGFVSLRLALRVKRNALAKIMSLKWYVALCCSQYLRDRLETKLRQAQIKIGEGSILS